MWHRLLLAGRHAAARDRSNSRHLSRQLLGPGSLYSRGLLLGASITERSSCITKLAAEDSDRDPALYSHVQPRTYVSGSRNVLGMLHGSAAWSARIHEPRCQASAHFFSSNAGDGKAAGSALKNGSTTPALEPHEGGIYVHHAEAFFRRGLHHQGTEASSPPSVLVLNAGSSSLKYALYEMGEKTKLSFQGLVEQIGSSTKGFITHKATTSEGKTEIIENRASFKDHKSAMAHVIRLMSLDQTGGGSSLTAVGHRVVHGGEAVTASCVITEEVKRAIEKATPLAPLHNPPNLQGIKVAEDFFGCPQVAVFDTAFHSTLPPHAFTYAIPQKLYRELGIRRYGFHGTSYMYLLGEAAKMLKKEKEDVNLIILHLGAGASMAAIKNGKCIDTTMGVTPLEGLVMATRCGDIDAAVVKILADLKGLSTAQVDNLLNKESGLLGICGEKDMKSVVERAESGDAEFKLALDTFVHRVRKYLGAYLVHLGGRVDAVVFSAGIGERSSPVRSRICEGLESFGIVLNVEKNGESRKEEREIQSLESRIKVLVIPTDEELCIAQETLKVVSTAFPRNLS